MYKKMYEIIIYRNFGLIHKSLVGKMSPDIHLLLDDTFAQCLILFSLPT